MSDADQREEALQSFVDGRIDERELRRRLVALGESEMADRLEEELAAYRAVWAGLEVEPPLELGPAFARRTTRAALSERRTAIGARQADLPDGRFGVLAAMVSGVTLAAALAAAVLLLPVFGIEAAGESLERIVKAAATVPSALWGAFGTAAVLYLVDAAWAWKKVRPSSP